MFPEKINVVALIPIMGNINDKKSKELIIFCRNFIAGYKIPKTFDFTYDPLPLSGTGKVLKRELREPYWSNYTKNPR